MKRRKVKERGDRWIVGQSWKRGKYKRERERDRGKIGGEVEERGRIKKKRERRRGKRPGWDLQIAFNKIYIASSIVNSNSL